MTFKLNLYRLRENRDMKPSTFAALVSTSLYEKRFGPYFVGPIVAGLEDGKPIIVNYDSIGCSSQSNFCSMGTAGDMLLGTLEAYYKPDLAPEELEEIVGQSLLCGIDRDILSGWGGVVYLM